MFNSCRGRILAASLFIFAFFGTATAGTEVVRIEGVTAPVKVTRDTDGIAHIQALRSQDLYFMQGYVHAQDRLFQMDLTRRQPSGTVAELLGPEALPGDIEARTIGLRRAAERSLPALTRRTRQALEAYAAGVNRWVEENDLPPEYGILGIDDFEAWTTVDSVVIAKAIAFSLSFDLDTGLTEDYSAFVSAFGTTPEAFAKGATLFAEDVFRSMPFDCASTVPDATGEYPFIAAGNPDQVPNCISDSVTVPSYVADGGNGTSGTTGEVAGAQLAALASRVDEKLRRSGFIRRVLDADGQIGSNEWGVTGRLGANGRPVIANDPHLSLDTPSTFYPIGLRRPGMDVFGSSFAGVPFVVLGVNRHIQWGATTNPMDVTDAFVELVGIDGEGYYTLFQGKKERVVPVAEEFYFNNFGGGTTQAPPGQTCGVSDGCSAEIFIPAATLIVPRRNNGPIVAFLQEPPSGENPGPVPAVSVQYTGFSATRELDTFRLWNESRNLRNFQHGLQFFDFGSQNWVYADVYGNTAYFASAEMPIRKDLQAGSPAQGTIPGLFPPGVPVPPWFLRDGTSGDHEWLPKQKHYPGQAIPYEILGPDEMPHTINPPNGYFVNANNDPAGTTLDNNPLNQLRKGGQGIYYLNPGYAGGFRAGTITLRLRETLRDNGRASVDDMQRIQSDVTLLDARYFVPLILKAWKRATADGAADALARFADDKRLEEAIGRLMDWDFSTPTGIPEGYDAGDDPDDLQPPSGEEIANSIAATIYSVWRGQAIDKIVDDTLRRNRIDPDSHGPGSAQAMTALKNLFDNFEARQGFGASGVDFFAVDGVDDREDARDVRLLGALESALHKLAGSDFERAFGGSGDQSDYRWGRLHRIVLNHPFVRDFDIPSSISGFPSPLNDLRGIPTDGGFGVVDASSHGARADEWDEFDFGSGPVRRFVGEPARGDGRAESIWAGGTSGVPFPGNPFYSNLLPRWLVNDTVEIDLGPFAGGPAYSRTLYLPERKRRGWRRR